MGDIPNVEKNRLVVEGPTGNDLKVDSGGSLQGRLFDSSGAALIGQKLMADSIPVTISSNQTSIPVSFAQATNLTIQLLYDSTNSQPVNANEFQDVLEYTVPTGYNLSVADFAASSSSAADAVRAIRSTSMATYNTGTNTFTDGLAITLPQFATRIYAHVLSAIGSGANDTLTITYTNSMGTTGRTATVIIPKSSLAGTRIEIILQTGDYGVIDITNITHTQTGQAGNVEIEGVIEIFYLLLAVGNQQYETTGAPNALVVKQGETITLQYKTGSVAAKSRRISLVGPLSPV